MLLAVGYGKGLLARCARRGATTGRSRSRKDGGWALCSPAIPRVRQIQIMLMIHGEAGRCFLTIMHSLKRRTNDREVLRIRSAIEARAERSEAVYRVIPIG